VSSSSSLESSTDLAAMMNAVAQLPPEQFELALKAVETQLARDHELRMEQERNRLVEAESVRSHALFTRGLVAGFVVVIGMVTGSVVVGVQGHVWLSASLSGPGVIVLASLFVLRRLDAKQLRLVSRGQANALAGTTADPGNPTI
jgi:hypothetical protein